MSHCHCLQELLSDHAEKQAIIFLNNVSFSLLKLIVEYVYRGAVNIDHTELQKFLQTARALKISGLVNYGEEEPPPVKKNPPKLSAHKPGSAQKRNLGDSTVSASNSTPPKANKIAKKEGSNPLSNRPPIRQRHQQETPLAPDEIQAAYLTLELEVETPEENANEDAEEVENIPFMQAILGMYQDY